MERVVAKQQHTEEDVHEVNRSLKAMPTSWVVSLRCCFVLQTCIAQSLHWAAEAQILCRILKRTLVDGGWGWGDSGIPHNKCKHEHVKNASEATFAWSAGRNAFANDKRLIDHLETFVLCLDLLFLCWSSVCRATENIKQRQSGQIWPLKQYRTGYSERPDLAAGHQNGSLKPDNSGRRAQYFAYRNSWKTVQGLTIA